MSDAVSAKSWDQHPTCLRWRFKVFHGLAHIKLKQGRHSSLCTVILSSVWTLNGCQEAYGLSACGMIITREVLDVIVQF